MNVLLSTRDREILETLLRKVRVLSIPQIARTWWECNRTPDRNARDRIHRLVESGWVSVVPTLARPEIPVSIPVCVWKPETPRPDFGAIAYRLQSRWKLPARPGSVVLATRDAARRLGGRGGRPPRVSESTHDQHLAAVYLLKRKTQPREAEAWICEDLYPREWKPRGRKVPDALVVRRSGTKAVEWGGEYAKSKVEEFHEHCVRQGYRYEIW